MKAISGINKKNIFLFIRTFVISVIASVFCEAIFRRLKDCFVVKSTPRNDNEPNAKLLFMIGIVILLFLFLNRSAIISHIRTERELAQSRAKIKTLNLFRPSGFYAGRHGQIDLSTIAPHMDYYLKVAEFFPTMAEAHGILGICYFYTGEKEKAVEALKRAIDLNPTFFWFQYNLGIVFMSQNELLAASKMFENALKLPPQPTLQTISTSKLFTDLRLALEGGYPIDTSLMDAYKKAYVLSQLCRNAFFKKEALPSDISQIQVKIF